MIHSGCIPNATVATMGRCLSIINCCSASLTTLSTGQALVLSHLDCCSKVWSGARKRDLGKLQLAQNRAARLALKSTQRANINDMHVCQSLMAQSGSGREIVPWGDCGRGPWAGHWPWMLLCVALNWNLLGDWYDVVVEWLHCKYIVCFEYAIKLLFFICNFFFFLLKRKEIDFITTCFCKKCWHAECTELSV